MVSSVKRKCCSVRQCVRSLHQLRRNFIRKAAQIESMDAIGRPCRVVGVNHDIHGVARQIDNWSRVDADIRPVIGAAQRIRHWCTEIRLEQHGTAACIDRIYRIALGGYVDDVVVTLMTARGDEHVGHIEWLCIDLVVQRNFLQQAKGGTANVCRREHSFVRIPSRTVIVIVVGPNRRLS